MANVLGIIVNPYSSENSLTAVLYYVWHAVGVALKKSEGVLESSIATFEQFEANVEHQGRSRFYTLLRETAEKKSWSDLLMNGMHLDLVIAIHLVTASCADVFF